MARDGFGIGINVRGQYQFNGDGDRQRLRRLPAGHGLEPRARPVHRPRPARGPLRRLRALRPGRLEGEQRPDRLPRPALRARRHVAREERPHRQLHGRRRRPPRRPERGGGEQAAPRAAGPRPDADRRPGRLPGHARQRGQEQLQPARRLRLAPRRQRQDGASAAASASSTPRSPCRACATCWPRTSSATTRTTAAAASRTPSRRGRRSSTPRPSATRGSTRTCRAPDIYQYNLTLEREIGGNMGVRVSYIGSTMRKLLTDSRLQHPEAQHRVLRPQRPERTTRGCRTTRTAPTWTSSRTRARGSSTRCQLELTRRWRSGLAFDVAYTYADSDTTVPDSGNSTIGVVLYNPWEPDSDRGPGHQRGEAPRGRERDLGHPGGQGPQVRLEHAGLGGRALRRVDGLHHLPGPQRPQPDAVLQRLLLLQPLEHREAARRPRQLLLLRVAPGRDRRPEHPADAGPVVRPDGVRHPGPPASSATPRRAASRGRAPGS